MKSKISRIMGVGLSLMLLASLLVFASPVSAGTLSVSAETKIPKTEDNILGPAGVDVVSLAVSGSTMYAATGVSSTNITYKSTNAGATWSSLTTTTDYPSPAPAISLVAVAADDPNIVAIVESVSQKVHYSSDGGASWDDLLAPGAMVNAIDISPAVSGIRYIAAGGSTAGPVGELWTIKLSMAEAWTARVSGNATANQEVIAAVKFSPKFATDKLIAVVSGNTTTTNSPVYFQAFRHEIGAYTWNKGISFLTADWGTGIAITDKLEAWAGDNLSAASIALIDTFSGTSEGDRIAFVAVAGDVNGGGVVRIVDSFVKKFETWSSGDEGPIGSLAYDASGKLLAGDYDEAKVYVSLSPMATDPRFERTTTLKQPGGTSKTLVAWSGTTAVAATSGDESAFATSTDSGKSWNDISLIDTTVANFADVAVNTDGTKYYLTTFDAVSALTNDASLWLTTNSGTTWTRVFSKRNLATANADLMVRIAPENADVVYLVSKGTNNIWVSKNGGTASWTEVPVYKLPSVVDLVVQSADIVHAISASQYSKTIDAGASWSTEVGLDGLATAKNISLAPNNDILVGGTNNIAFSKDAGATFQQAVSAAGAGTVFIVADKDYAKNNTVYAGAGTTVKRGKAQKATQTWGSRGPTITGENVTGMASVGGVIYVLSGSPTSSTLHRALNLTTTVDSADLALWSNKTPSSALGAYAIPQALKISPTYKDGPKLWFVNTNGTDSLVSLFDPIALTAPTLSSPADKATVAVNADTGKAYNVTFVWSRYADSAITKMQLQIATDSAFTGIISDITFAGIDSNSIAKIVGPTGPTTTVTTTVTETTATYTYTSTDNVGGITTITVPATTTTVPSTSTVSQVAEFNPGSTYYWRVRVAVDGPMYSPFSKVQSFTVAPPSEVVVTSPVAGATDVGIRPTLVWTAYPGAISYEVEVSEDADFAIADITRSTSNTFFQIEEDLAYSTTYYWRARGVTGPAPSVKAEAPGGPWMAGVFTTEAKPVVVKPPAPEQIIVTQPGEVKIVEVPVTTVTPAAIPSYLLWVIIIIGAILVIALIVLIVRTRRVA